jgi:hypothetical protein
MIHIITKAVLALMAMLALALPARAATSENVKVRMDKEFRVGTAALSAGDYSIRVLNTGSDSPTLIFESEDGSRVFAAAWRFPNDFDSTGGETQVVMVTSENGLTVKEVRLAGQAYRYQLIGQR